MKRIPGSTFNEQSIYASLELSKNSWLLAIQLPGRLPRRSWTALTAGVKAMSLINGVMRFSPLRRNRPGPGPRPDNGSGGAESEDG